MPFSERLMSAILGMLEPQTAAIASARAHLCLTGQPLSTTSLWSLLMRYSAWDMCEQLEHVLVLSKAVDICNVMTAHLQTCAWLHGLFAP